MILKDRHTIKHLLFIIDYRNSYLLLDIVLHTEYLKFVYWPRIKKRVQKIDKKMILSLYFLPLLYIIFFFLLK